MVTQQLSDNTHQQVPQPSSPLRFKALKIILGIATFLPIFGLTAGFLYLAQSTSFLAGLGFAGILILIGIWYIFLEFIYIIIVCNNRSISKAKKTLWAVMFSLGILFHILPTISLTRPDIFMNSGNYRGWLPYISYFSLLLYWYLYIWKEPKRNKLK